MSAIARCLLIKLHFIAHFISANKDFLTFLKIKLSFNFLIIIIKTLYYFYTTFKKPFTFIKSFVFIDKYKSKSINPK